MLNFIRLNFCLATFLSLGVFLIPCCADVMAKWEDHWMQAVQHCEEKNYQAAETEFTLSIKDLEDLNNHEHPHVYVDRARLLCLLNRQMEALPDINLALDSQKLTGDDLTKALLTRMHIYATLDRHNDAMHDYWTFRSVYPFPQTEFSRDHIIIRNVPECDCYKSMITKIFVSSELCESEADIQWLKSGICIAKRKECHCECNERICSPRSEVTTY